ncbi:unnamed protein product [Chilo suppressalis]|uniref:Uncharacterized protein n=1 Tax=Chilo suppressalis TaxID=168631 RepID=A0ABN8B7S9_CHISP|nr:unnamed protein product [Chilo suppressalis]
MVAGFVKAESTNLPRIDALMVGEFVALTPISALRSRETTRHLCKYSAFSITM